MGGGLWRRPKRRRMGGHGDPPLQVHERTWVLFCNAARAGTGPAPIGARKRVGGVLGRYCGASRRPQVPKAPPIPNSLCLAVGALGVFFNLECKNLRRNTQHFVRANDIYIRPVEGG